MFGLMLQWGVAGFQDLLQQLENLGFFQYVLPFLLIFAVVYALLTQIKIFEENKGAALLIAVAIGFLALQLNYVPAFFQDIFPKFGVALSILLVALILAGAFISEEKGAFKWIFFGLGAFIFFVILFSSLSSISFLGSYWWDQYGALLITSIVIIAAVVGVILASGKKT